MERIKERKRYVLRVVWLCMICVTVFLMGCANGEQTDSSSISDESIINMESTAEMNMELLVESTKESFTEWFVEEPIGIEVVTPYITLYYPEEWDGEVEVKQSEKNDNHAITFVTEIADKEVLLFSIVFGSEYEEGFWLGQLNDEKAGEVKVFSVMNEIDPEGWNQEEYDSITSMQERVNDFIMQISEDPRYVPNR